MHSLFDWFFSLIVLFIKQVQEMCVCIFFTWALLINRIDSSLITSPVSSTCWLLGHKKLKKETKIKRKLV